MESSPHGQGRLVSYQYFEADIVGRRVLELGHGGTESAAWLADRASQVTTQDLCLELDAFPLEDEAADMVLVPELELWAGWPPLVQELRRVIIPRGLILLSVRSGDLTPGVGLTYEDLEELLGRGFSHVRILGQIPFFGFTVADFQPEEADLAPTLDCSLVREDAPPRRYLAMASDAPLPAQPYGVIQVHAPGDDAGEVGSSQLDDLRDRLAEQRSRAETERLRAQAAERALGEAQASARQHARRVDTAERRADSLMTRLEQGAVELAGLHQRLADMQAQGQSDRWRVDELSGLAQQLQQELDEQVGAGGKAPRGAGSRLEELKRALQEAEARVAEQSRRATNAEARLAARSTPEALPKLEIVPPKVQAPPPEPEPGSHDLRHQVDTLEQGAELHHLEMDNLHLKVRELKAYNGELRREADEAAQALEEQSVQLAETRADNRRLRQENAKLARKLAGALGELQKMKREQPT